MQSKGTCRSMRTLIIKVFIYIFVSYFYSSSNVFSQPCYDRKPDVFGNVWTLERIKKDTELPAGNWKYFDSDIYGFLWVGGRNGLIRFDPRKPENGWRFFNADTAYRGGAVRAIKVSPGGLIRVTLKSGEIYDVDVDSKWKQYAVRIQNIDKDVQSGAWKLLSPMPYSSHDVYGAELKGKIYIPGGQALYGFPATLKTFDRMFIYDTEKDSWQLSSLMKLTRRYCNVGTLGGKIWVIGGYTGNGRDQVTSTVEIYDPATDRWTDGPMLNATCASSVAGVVNGRLYVIFSNYERTASYTASIALGETAWRSENPPPYPIIETDGCVLDDKIYIIIAKFGLIMYDPGSQTWQSDFPSVPQSKAPRSPVVVSYKDKIWVISGADIDDEKKVWCFSPREREWAQGPSFPQSIRWADGIEINGKLYVFGGATYSARHEIFVFWNSLFTLKDSEHVVPER